MKTFYGITDGYEFERLIGKTVSDIEDMGDIKTIIFTGDNKEVDLQIDLFNNEISITEEMDNE